MLSKSCALMYNFKDDFRTQQIRRFLHHSGISTRIVTAPDFLQPLGALFEIPGFDRNPVFNLGGNFTEEMMVLKDFTEQQLDGFLQFIRTSGLNRVELKAVLTPYNQHWNSLQLFQELTREREAMRRQ